MPTKEQLQEMERALCRQQPPKPEDFQDEDGSINWERFYEAQEEWDIEHNGMR